MTVLEVIRSGAALLDGRGVASPRLEVELMLSQALGQPPLHVRLDPQRRLGAGELAPVRAALRRRARREPLQHILGTACFCGLELSVSRAVLVPRPETELLAERAWEWLRVREAAGRPAPRLLDLGTGSGCLALAILKHTAVASALATDLSPAALAVAAANARRHGLEGRVAFARGDAFAALQPGERFDLLVANPRHIPTAEIGSLEPEVRDYDPREALDGGPDGLALFRVLAAEGARHLKPDGVLMAEFGDGQGPAAAALFSSRGWAVGPLIPDLSGRARFIAARPAAGGG